MQKVVIFGAAAFAEVACTYLEDDDRFEVAGFTQHDAFLTNPRLLGYDVVAFERLEERFPPGAYAMLVAVGYKRLNRTRAEIYRACKARGYSLITFVSKHAIHVGRFEIGDNCFVFDANVIQPHVRIGNNVVIWSGNHIGHHATIADHCFIASHAVIAGGAAIGEGCFVGVNATIRDGVRIAPHCIIGAGTMIMRDTKEGEVYRAAATPPAPYPSRRWKV